MFAFMERGFGQILKRFTDSAQNTTRVKRLSGCQIWTWEHYAKKLDEEAILAFL